MPGARQGTRNSGAAAAGPEPAEDVVHTGPARLRGGGGADGDGDVVQGAGELGLAVPVGPQRGERRQEQAVYPEVERCGQGDHLYDGPVDEQLHRAQQVRGGSVVKVSTARGAQRVLG